LKKKIEILGDHFPFGLPRMATKHPSEP